MNEQKFQELIGKPNGIYLVLKEMNDEINRLISFAKNSNTFGHKIFPDLVQISDSKK